MLNDLRKGIDPKLKTENQTVQQALDAYLAARKDLRPRQRTGLPSNRAHASDWMDKPLRSITGDDVEAKHRALAAATKERGHPLPRDVDRNGALRTFRIIWNFAADRTPDLPANPVKRLKRQWYAEPRRTGMVRPEGFAALLSGGAGAGEPGVARLHFGSAFHGYEARGVRDPEMDRH